LIKPRLMMGAGQGAADYADSDVTPEAPPKARGHCQKRTRGATLEIPDKTDVFARVAGAAERIRRSAPADPGRAVPALADPIKND
jgi:hypothetical protein